MLDLLIRSRSRSATCIRYFLSLRKHLLKAQNCRIQVSDLQGGFISILPLIGFKHSFHNKRPSETYLFRRPCFIAKSKTYFAVDAAVGAGALAGVLLGTEAAEAA